MKIVIFPKHKYQRILIAIGIIVVAASTAILVIRSSIMSRQLVTASAVGNADRVGKLISSGASPSSYYYSLDGLGVGNPRISKNVAVISAAGSGHVDVVEMLLDKGASINQTDNFGRSALLAAARHDRISVARLLVDRGTDLNQKDDLGRTALFWAAGYASPEMVEILKLAGASASVDDAGLSVFDIASLRGSPEKETILKILSSGRR